MSLDYSITLIEQINLERKKLSNITLFNSFSCTKPFVDENCHRNMDFCICQYIQLSSHVTPLD